MCGLLMNSETDPGNMIPVPRFRTEMNKSCINIKNLLEAGAENRYMHLIQPWNNYIFFKYNSMF